MEGEIGIMKKVLYIISIVLPVGLIWWVNFETNSAALCVVTGLVCVNTVCTLGILYGLKLLLQGAGETLERFLDLNNPLRKRKHTHDKKSM